MDEEGQNTEANQKDSVEGGYKKRPWWQWALIYVLVGIVVYLIIYYLFFAGRSVSVGY